MTKLATSTNLEWDLIPTDIKVNDKILDTHYALVRNDNDKVLHIHKNSYNPYYNSEFRSFMEDLQIITSFENLQYQEYKEGRIVLGYLENKQGTININGFDINQYLVLGNGHDGTKGIFLGSSEIMLRCMNQFGRIINSNVIYHTKNNTGKIDNMKRAYEIYFKDVEKMKEIYVQLSKVNIDQELLDSLKIRLFEIDKKESEKGLSTRTKNQMMEFDRSIRKETQDLGQTLFGFFHATTHYTTHIMKGEKVFGNLLGNSNQLNERSLKLVTELIR